jgi:hypothetical protein
LPPERAHLDQLARDGVNCRRVEAELARPHQSLARQLQEHSPERGRRADARAARLDRRH